VSLIKLVNVTKRFGEITALDRLDLSIYDGEYLCILGQTGAGKTTLLRIIAGLLKLDEGEIYIEGKLVNNVPPEERDTVYMFQQYALFPHMNVWQNVSYSPTIKDMDKERLDKFASEVLDMVRLGDRREALPNELSGGMQQRVALARGIASGARILLLDEPLGALDARLRVNLRAQLRRLVKDQNITVVHVTHDQEEALMIADRVVVLRKGRIEQTGRPNEIYTKPQSIFVTSFVGGANFIEGVVSSVEKSGSNIKIQGGNEIRITNSNQPVGERVVVAIRLEDILVATKKILKHNNLLGVIDSAVFIGGSMEYRIKLTNNIIISSKILIFDKFKAFKVGEQVVISFPPDRVFVFPYPTEGLMREIEAI
jgi:ABC-type Fe3+/spermidine/putrescine transport system ATPase subunit